MDATLTSLIELAVGLGCVVAGLGAWRRLGIVWVGAVLGLAGGVAIVHAGITLLS